MVAVIYIFAPEADSHALELARTKAFAGHEVQHITANFFVNNGVSVSENFILVNGRELNRLDVLVFRRDLDFRQLLYERDYSGNEQNYLNQILEEHATSFLYASESVCRVINPKSAHCLALSKPQQLIAARNFGLNTPPTIASNNINDIRVWLKSGGRTVIKPYRAGFQLTGGRSGCVQAVETSGENLEKFSFNESPMILQQLIDSDDEIRVVVRPNSLLCFSLGWSNKTREVDWRPHQDKLKINITALPIDEEVKISKLCSFLGIGYGTVDLIKSGNIYYFLEANLAGNYQMLCPMPINPAEWIAEGLAALHGVGSS